MVIVILIGSWNLFSFGTKSRPARQGELRQLTINIDVPSHVNIKDRISWPWITAVAYKLYTWFVEHFIQLYNKLHMHTLTSCLYFSGFSNMPYILLKNKFFAFQFNLTSYVYKLFIEFKTVSYKMLDLRSLF